jgi:hypothetical protein
LPVPAGDLASGQRHRQREGLDWRAAREACGFKPSQQRRMQRLGFAIGGGERRKCNIG